MAELAEFEFRADERPLHPVMRRVAASLPNASWHLAGQDAVIGRNHPDERFPEHPLGRALAVSATEHSIAFFAERAIPHPTSAGAGRDAFHQARLTHDFDPIASSRFGIATGGATGLQSDL
jgi:hypothetical protein